MPALSPTMTEGTLSKWLKKEGYPVPKGPLARFGSKLLGPLQYMMPGKAMAPDLTDKERAKFAMNAVFEPFEPFERGR